MANFSIEKSFAHLCRSGQNRKRKVESTQQPQPGQAQLTNREVGCVRDEKLWDNSAVNQRKQTWEPRELVSLTEDSDLMCKTLNKSNYLIL